MKYFILLFYPFLTMAESSKDYLGIYYLVPTFGHIHVHPSKESSSFTTISCGHPTKTFLVKNGQTVNEDWYSVDTAGHKGFIQREYLDVKKPDCFQSKYPKFFNTFNLDLSQMYYWGRLYDQYIQGKAKVR